MGGGCDEGFCCNKINAVSDVEDGNYGAFSQYIWRLEEGAALTAGHSVTLCSPDAYFEAHKKAEEEAGKPTTSATVNLQIVLDTIPGVREAYQIEDAETAEDWITLWGADKDTIDGTEESAECLKPAETTEGESFAKALAASAAVATAVYSLI